MLYSLDAITPWEPSDTFVRMHFLCSDKLLVFAFAENGSSDAYKRSSLLHGYLVVVWHTPWALAKGIVVSKNRALISWKYVLALWNSLRICASSVTFDAIHINPAICTWCKSRHLPSSSIWVHSSGRKPNFDSSWAMCSSSKHEITRLCFSACLLISVSSFMLSTACMSEMYGAMYFTLLACKCPMKCHSMSLGKASYLVCSSCTRLSPKCVVLHRKLLAAHWPDEI